jgi:hypothetical protein
MSKHITCRAFALICIMLAMASPAFGGSAEKSSLMKLIEDNENIHMDVDEMAFLLATHGYDAMPNGNHVVVNIGGEALKIVPTAYH